MLRSVTGFVLALALSSAAFAASAQTTPPSEKPAATNDGAGVGEKTNTPAEVDKGQNMILPSAGRSGESAAPTMVYDCKAKPQDCTTPMTPSDKAKLPEDAPHQSPIKP
jgi:hypothetical protein